MKREIFSRFFNCWFDEEEVYGRSERGEEFFSDFLFPKNTWRLESAFGIPTVHVAAALFRNLATAAMFQKSENCSIVFGSVNGLGDWSFK